MSRISDIEENEYQERVRDLISRILQAAFRSRDLRTFLDEIVRVGAEKTEAKSCVIFLLEESEDANGRIMRAYATSGKVGKILKEKDACYYVPKREPFEHENAGRNKINAYLQKNYYRRGKGKDFIDKLRVEKKTLTDIIVEKNHNLRELVENGELPMGITASIVKTKEPFLAKTAEDVRKHPEWRGSYEGAHEICTSLVEVPLKTSGGKILGMIKIENHEKSNAFSDFKDLKNQTVPSFSEKHQKILTILADSIIIAIENILYRADTYKKIFGTEMLKKIEKLEIAGSYEDKPKKSGCSCDATDVNKEIHNRINEFYRQLKIEIEDIGEIDTIYNKITRVISEIASILNLQATLDIIGNVGPAFESLLSTDVRYREHFIHQFQVFLMGYYLINKKGSLGTLLLEHLKENEEDNYNLVDVLKVWFIASIFHDYGYSIGKIENWLEKYFKRVEVPSRFQIGWADLLYYYENEKTNIVGLLSRYSGKSNNKIATIIKEAFIDNHDHGVISSLVLMSILQTHQVSPVLLGKACCAITLHTDAMYSKFGKLNISQFPFAFLLVFCDNAQQWGRPRMMSLIPEIDVKLEDIEIIDSNKFAIKLRYHKLKPEQKRLIQINTSPPTKYWYTTASLRFSIALYEGDEIEPYITYSIPLE